MPQPLFTAPDTWLGGYYELAIELGHRSDERLGLALKSIWSLPELEVPYERRDAEPEDQTRVEPQVAEHPHERVLVAVQVVPGRRVRLLMLDDPAQRVFGLRQHALESRYTSMWE